MQLTVTGLSCVRGGRLVLEHVAFGVPAGGALVITGPNGAGKSSLLRTLAGLVRPSAGAMRLDGGDPDLGLGEQCHYVGHLDPAKGALTVLENLRFWVRHLGGGAGMREEDALRAAGLGHLAGLPASYLSAGQRRRLSLARLLAVSRPVWLLDEPTTALDAAGQAMLGGEVRRHREGGGLVLAATHAPLGFEGAAELMLGRTS
ncbi:MAG: heme ABC exporter ATP-binding protein CcmA [Variibacter sp.]|nr:heme ABC exporter ATP-binding protein CcmA [Variibacter sp.]